MEYRLPFNPPLLEHFSEFVFFDGFLPHEVDRIRNLWVDENSERAAVSGKDPYKDDLRQSSVIGIEHTQESRWIYDRIASLGTTCNAQRYHFDLDGFLEPLQFTEYKTGQFFEWHMDFQAAEVSHRKLSVTVQLSDGDSYEGGDLQFMINNRIATAPRRKGTVVVFPSFITHRVTEVTDGTRNSIVGWLSGPPYR